MAMSLKIETIPVTDFQQNARVLIDEESSKAIIVDPGGEAEKFSSYFQQNNLELEAIWLTHAHLDHCGAVADLLEHYSCKLYGHPNEEMLRAKVEDICAMYGMAQGDMKNCPEPTDYISGGEVLTFAYLTFEVRFCPGHSPGHLIFYCASEKLLIAGDTLFQSSIGRTDLPGGDHNQLLQKIKSEIYTLPHDTKVLPGHGPNTTVGVEALNNPFVTAG